jgi:hypothetical protein
MVTKRVGLISLLNRKLSLYRQHIYNDHTLNKLFKVQTHPRHMGTHYTATTWVSLLVFFVCLCLFVFFLDQSNCQSKNTTTKSVTLHTGLQALQGVGDSWTTEKGKNHWLKTIDLMNPLISEGGANKSIRWDHHFQPW